MSVIQLPNWIDGDEDIVVKVPGISVRCRDVSTRAAMLEWTDSDLPRTGPEVVFSRNCGKSLSQSLRTKRRGNADGFRITKTNGFQRQIASQRFRRESGLVYEI